MYIVTISKCTSLDFFLIQVSYKQTLTYQKKFSDKILSFSGTFKSKLLQMLHEVMFYL